MGRKSRQASTGRPATTARIRRIRLAAGVALLLFLLPSTAVSQATQGRFHPRPVARIYLMRASRYYFGHLQKPVDPAWIGGTDEAWSAAIGYSFAPHWAVAAGTVIDYSSSHYWIDYGPAARFFIAYYTKWNLALNRVVSLGIDVRPSWFGRNPYFAAGLEVSQTFYGISPGAAFRWRMDSFDPKESSFVVGLTLGFGGWAIF